MKNNLILLISVVFVFSLDVVAQKKMTPNKSKPTKSQSGKEFVSNEGKFKILFPAAPAVKVSEQGEGDLRLKSTTHRASGDTILYGVTVTESFSAAEVNDEKNLEALRNLIMGNGTFIKESKITLNGINGWEIVYQKLDNAIARHRIYSVGKRWYEVVAVIIPKGEDPESAITRNKAELGKYFDSFQILK